jgi:hypothetical protein
MARIDLSGRQIPTLSKLNIDGELTLDAASGTTGQVLTSAGAGVTPTWTTPASGSLGYVGNFQTTASAGTTFSLGVASVSGTGGGAVSLSGGSTTNTLGVGGSLTLSGGNAATGTNTTSGGSVVITGGNANASSGVGGSVSINAGLGSGPSNNGDSTVYVGNNSNTTLVSIGSSTNKTSFVGKISLDGYGYNVLTSAGPATPGVLAIDNGNLQFNFNYSTASNAQGAFEYSTNIFRGFQTSTGAGRVPVIHSVFSLANSTASQNTTQSVFAAANDVLSSLEAAKLYRFKGKYYSSFVYAGAAGVTNINFAFSNSPTAFKYTFKTYPQTAGTTNIQQGASSVITATAIGPSQSSSATWVTEFEGYFTTHATLTSTFTPQFICVATNSSTTTMQPGSWIEVEKLGTSTTTNIAGNWA